jgi:hypothetical protein
MGGNEYYDSEEVVTDAEGRFLIRARQTWTLNPLSEIYGPEFFIVKFGYGRWQFRDFDKWREKDGTEGGVRGRGGAAAIYRRGSRVGVAAVENKSGKN